MNNTQTLQHWWTAVRIPNWVITWSVSLAVYEPMRHIRDKFSVVSLNSSCCSSCPRLCTFPHGHPHRHDTPSRHSLNQQVDRKRSFRHERQISCRALLSLLQIVQYRNSPFSILALAAETSRLVIPDVNDRIVRISASSRLPRPYPIVTSPGSQVSAVITRACKCVFSQELGTRDSKCTMVPVVSNGMSTSPDTVISNSLKVSNGLSFTERPKARN